MTALRARMSRLLEAAPSAAQCYALAKAWRAAAAAASGAVKLKTASLSVHTMGPAGLAPNFHEAADRWERAGQMLDYTAASDQDKAASLADAKSQDGVARRLFKKSPLRGVTLP